MRFWRIFSIVCTTLLLLFALIAIAITSSSTQGPASNAQPDSLSSAAISLERTGCYGTCPSYVVTLKGDGTVEYVGRNYVKIKGPQSGTIKSEVLKPLMDEFARTGFMTIADTYSEEKCRCVLCTDMPSAITRLTNNGVMHTVNHYYGCRCAPKSLFDLERAIDKAANVEQWTGDTSKSGPFGTTCAGE